MNQRSRAAIVILAIFVICGLGTLLVVNWQPRQGDDTSMPPQDGVVTDRPRMGVDVARPKRPGESPAPKIPHPVVNTPGSAQSPKIKSYEDYLKMVLGVPWGSAPSRKKTDDGLPGVTKATLGLANIHKREAVHFAARLCDVLRRHDVAIPEDLNVAVDPRREGQLPSLTLDDHESVLTHTALLLWIASWDSRDMQRRLRPLKLDLAWDLLMCVATDCPVGYARAIAAGEMTLLACDLDRIQPLDSTLCAAQTIAAIDGIWAKALDLSSGRWTIDSAATLFALESIPLQGWMIVKVISMDQVSEASLTRFVDDLAGKVRGLRQADRPPGTDHVIQNYLDFVDSGLRKEIPLLVPTVEDKQEIDVLVRGLLERLTTSDELQRSVFGHNCKTVKLLWCFGSLQSGEVKMAFEAHGADGKVSRVVGDRSIRRTQAGIRWD